MQTCSNCHSALPDTAQACPYCGNRVRKHDDVRRRLWLRMRAVSLTSPVASTASIGAFTTYVITSTLILSYVILGVFLRPPAASHATSSTLITTPTTLDFGKVAAGRKVVLTEMVKTNSASQPQWKVVSGNAGWLNITLGNTIAEPATFRELIYDITADTSNLRDGRQYSAIFTISSNGAEDQRVLIKIQVVSSPSPAKLNISPPTLDFGTQNIGSQGMQFLSVSNSGQMDLNWSADWGNTPWLSLTPDQGKIAAGGLPEVIQVQANTATLTPGQHSASIDFNSNGGNISVSVALVVAVGATPTPVVTTGSTPTPLVMPTVTSISPNSGSTLGGTNVTIAGSGFTGASQVLFGSTAAQFTISSDSQISAVSPAGSGTVDVTVVTTNATSAISAADQFTYNAPTIPVVTNISPNSGPTSGGTSVTITGNYFTGVTTVFFGSTTASSDGSTITAVSPAGREGTVHVTVTTRGGTSAATSADLFTYIPIPQ